MGRVRSERHPPVEQRKTSVRRFPSLLYLTLAAGCYQSTGADAAEGEDPAGTVLYLDFNGGAFDHASRDDATRNRTTLASAGPIDAAAFAHDRGVGGSYRTRDQVIDAIAELVRGTYSPFDVRVVTARPGSGAFSTVVVGGTMDDISHMGRCVGGGVDLAAGLAPIDCDDGRHRNVGFVAPDCLPESTPAAFRRLVALAIAHEAAHTFGLEHVVDGSGSLMQVGASELAWGRGAVLEPAACDREVQNDRAILRGNLGERTARPDVPAAPDGTPPALSVPLQDGAPVRDGFVPCVSVTDDSGVSLVVLQVYEAGVLVAQHARRDPPWTFPRVERRSSRTVSLRLTAIDRWDNLTEHRVSVVLDPSAPLPRCE